MELEVGGGGAAALFSAFVRCDLLETVASRSCVLPGPRFALRCDAEREGTAGEAQPGATETREERESGEACQTFYIAYPTHGEVNSLAD